MRLLKRLKDRTDEGFTLIELVIVVAIIGVLSAIAIPSYGTLQETSRVETGSSLAKNVYAAILVADYDGDSDTTTDTVIASVEDDKTDIVANDWTTEEDLCVTVTWVVNADSMQTYGTGC